MTTYKTTSSPGDTAAAPGPRTSGCSSADSSDSRRLRIVAGAPSERPVPTAADGSAAELLAQLNGPLRSSLGALSIASSVVAAHHRELSPRAQAALTILCEEVAWHQTLWLHLLASFDRAAREQDPPQFPTRTARSLEVREVLVRPPLEIDMATVGAFSGAVDSACASRAHRVVVDFSAVTFCGFEGLDVLVRGATALRAAGRALVVADPPPMLLRMSTLAGHDQLLGLAR